MAGHDIIAIGASTGGIEALISLVRELPESLPAAVFVVIHTTPNGRSLLPAILSRQGCLPAVAAQSGQAIVPGTIYVAPPDYHLLVRPGHIELNHGPRENRTRPAVDPLFRSAARAYGPRVVGVVLSGALGDGAAGLLAIKSRGGLAVVQDPADAIAGGMPRAALETVHVDYVLPVREIPAVLTALTMKGGERERIWAMHDADEEKDKSRELPQRDLREQALGQPRNRTSVYTCPECGGTLWEVDENGLTQFACHVGHRYGAEILLGQMSEELEAALWRCVRMFTEKATLTRQLAHRTRTSGDAEAAQRIEEQAALDDRHEAILRALVQEGTLRQLAQVLAAEEG